VNTGRGKWLRAAAVLSFMSIGWPVHLPTLQHVMRQGDLPIIVTPWGLTIRALSGPIEQAWGMDAIVVSILANGVFSLVDVLAGYWLWTQQKRGAILALVLLPLYWFFALGWAVPYMLIIGALRAIARFGWKDALKTMFFSSSPRETGR
jgi:hypothetical protein